MDSFLADNMSQEIYIADPKITFGEFHIQLFSLQGLYDLSEMLAMIFASRVYKNIIDENDHEFVK